MFFRPSKKASVFLQIDTDLFLDEKDGLVDSVVVVVVVVAVVVRLNPPVRPRIRTGRNRLRSRDGLLDGLAVVVLAGAEDRLPLLLPRVLGPVNWWTYWHRRTSLTTQFWGP